MTSAPASTTWPHVPPATNPRVCPHRSSTEAPAPEVTWRFLTTAPNVPLAQALASALASCGVVSQVVSDTAILGQAQPCSVLVDAAQIHRARLFLAQGQVSEEELQFLATGRITRDDFGK